MIPCPKYLYIIPTKIMIRFQSMARNYRQSTQRLISTKCSLILIIYIHIHIWYLLDLIVSIGIIILVARSVSYYLRTMPSFIGKFGLQNNFEICLKF